MKPAVRPRRSQQTELPLDLHGVADLCACLSLAVKQWQFYGVGNPATQRALAAANAVFQDIWAETDRLHCTVRENAFEAADHVVHEGGELSDSLPFLFYKDGIRELIFFPGFEGAELTRFVDVVVRARSVRSDDDDLVTLLWHEDLTCLRYGYVDATSDEQSKETAKRETRPPDPSGNIVRPLSARAATAEEAARTAYDDPAALPNTTSKYAAAVARDAPLGLDADEMAAIQADLDRELGRDVVHDVVTALLDSLEDAPMEKQGEILGVLAGLVPQHLSERRFELVATALTDLRRTADAGRVAPGQAAAVEAVWTGQQMTDALDTLLLELQAGDVVPRVENVEQVLAALGPVCFQRLVRCAESARNKDIRAVLQRAAAGAVTSHPDVVYAALDAPDANVLRAVLQLLQQNPDPAHVPRVERLCKHEDAGVRQAVMHVVVTSGGRGAIPWLRRALEDAHPAVRTAALWGLGTWRATEARGDLEARLRDRALADVPATEKMALFEAYARVAGAAALPVLAGILGGRSGWRGRWPTDLRVCAARVLRLTDNPEARHHLEKASRDPDDGVRRAAQRALQRLEGGG